MSDVYIVNPHLHVVRCGNDEILVKQGTRSLYSESIIDELRSGVLGDVVDRFRGGASSADVAAALKSKSDAVKQIIDALAEKGILVTPESELGALYTKTLFGAELSGVSSRLIGAGPLGQAIAEGLRETGVGDVQLFDPRETGTEAVDVDAVLEGADLVVVAWEHLSPKVFTEVNLASVEFGTPWLAAYVDGHEGIVGPTTVPGETACWFEYLTQTEASITQKDTYHVFKDHLSDIDLNDVTQFSPPPLRSVVAGFAVASCLRALSGQSIPTANRVLRVDLDRFTVDYQAILRLPRCPACGTQRAAYRQLFL